MIKVRAYAWLAICGTLLAAGSAVFWFGLLSDRLVIDSDDPMQVALGRQVYAERCAMCHGANLEGQPNWMVRKPNGRLPAPPHDASGHTWHHPDEQLIQMTKKGLSGIMPGYESDMPAFEKVLTEEQIAAVLAYIESTWPSEIRSRQRALTSATS